MRRHLFPCFRLPAPSRETNELKKRSRKKRQSQQMQLGREDTKFYFLKMMMKVLKVVENINIFLIHVSFVHTILVYLWYMSYWYTPSSICPGVLWYILVSYSKYTGYTGIVPYSNRTRCQYSTGNVLASYQYTKWYWYRIVLGILNGTGIVSY